MTVIVRRATARDIEAVAEVGHASWEATYRGLLPDFLLDRWTVAERIRRQRARARSNDPERRLWVLEKQAVVAAYASSGVPRDPLDEADVGEVYSCYVHPELWRQGLGRELMEHTLRDLFAREYRLVHLWCLAQNLRARRFYEAIGFAVDVPLALRRLGGVELEQTRFARRATGC